MNVVKIGGRRYLYGADRMREEHWEWPRSQEGPRSAYVLQEKGAPPVSIARIFFRMFCSSTRDLRAVGVGGVWTRPSERNKGYATELLSNIIKRIPREHPTSDVILLHAPAARKLYADLGFREVGGASGLYALPICVDAALLETVSWQVVPGGHF